MAAPMPCEAPVTMTVFGAAISGSFLFPGLESRRRTCSPSVRRDACDRRQRQIASLRHRVPSHIDAKSKLEQPSDVYSALIQVSEPVSFTDTSEMKMCSGLPSAVPRCSVENSRGPAFL